MSDSPWNQTPAPSASAERRTLSAPIIVVAVVVVALASGALAWWLQDARVRMKEQERAAAAAELAGLVTRVQTAESGAAAATQQLKQAQAAAEASAKQAADATAQIDVARRDAATVRTERDEARSEREALRVAADRMKANDLDPGALPALDLAKVFAGVTKVRTAVDLMVAGTAIPGVSKNEIDGKLGEALRGGGLEAASQSPFRVALFVSFGKEQPRRALGVMMLALRSMKVPGEAGSREVAVWGQQRTCTVSDAEASGQIQDLLKELCGELANSAGVKASGGSGASTAPTSPSAPNAPGAPSAPSAPQPAPAAPPAPASGGKP
ncbi:MAG: hypothetical protein ACKPEA_16915 [Planctomycetota bacterium]